MFSKRWGAAALLVGWVTVAAAADDKDVVLTAMQAELARTQSSLQLAGQPRPYFVQYSLRDVETEEFTAADGALVQARHRHSRPAAVEVHVGNTTDESAAEAPGFDSDDVTLDDDPLEVRRFFWINSDRAYREALERQGRKDRTVKQKSPLGDFSSAPAVHDVQPRLHQSVDEAAWKERVRHISAVGVDFPAVIRCRAGASFSVITRYLVNSEGTVVRDSTPLARVNVGLECEDADGAPMRETVSFADRDVKDLPSEAEMIRQVRAGCEQLLQRAKAPTLNDEYLGPVLFVGTTASDLFGEVLVPLVHPSTERLNRQVLPVAISVKDDPSLHSVDGLNLIGACSVDDEGVAVQPLTLIDHGKLTGVLADRKPTKASKASNGHGRSLGAEMSLTGIMPTNLVVSTTEGKSPEELKKLLLARCREQGLTEGLIVRAAGDPKQRFSFGGIAPIYYRISVDTGKEEMLRGVKRESINLRGMRRLIAMGNDPSVTNYVLQSTCFSIVTPSLLLGELQVTPTPDTEEERILLPAPPGPKAAP